MMMNTAAQNQSADPATVAISNFTAVEVKVCSHCQTELSAQNDGRRTSFGLNLCDDCLYL
ncbi:MAG: hypothetical protein EOP41_00010 [Sphingobacteriaceae bacterium]|nr:MAG: hypothetical protein EOP41_00010 [Sphingobacteriaceae bacterium]